MLQHFMDRIPCSMHLFNLVWITGSDCQEVLQSPTSRFNVAIEIMYVIAFSVACFISCRNFFKLMRSKRTWSVTHTSQTQLCIAFLLFLCSHSLGLVENFDTVVTLFDTGEMFKSNEFFYPEKSCLCWGIVPCF